MTNSKEVRIGTRGSQLALWQANWIKSTLEARHPDLVVSLVKIKTTGDKILDVPLAQVGGKGLFVKEIEEAMLDGRIDLAVHSMKDVPTDLPGPLHLPVIAEREDPRDALLSHGKVFDDLPQGAKIGTSSLRRQAQLLHRRPDMEMISLRGNLDTRIRKLDTEGLDAVILAAAGIRRMGWAEKITQILPTEISLPAIGQGAVGIECRREDPRINDLIAFIRHDDTFDAVVAERAFLKKLEGGCQVPIAAYAEVDGKNLKLRGLVGSVDGKELIEDKIDGLRTDGARLGTELGERVLAAGAGRILEEVYKNQ
ncbi:MAG: hydroxymethylbilane synthase [Deltaproteobacteria bacterium]|nr:hydroxymethylbilane synthase [Deltaproteobacteria bacterium]